MSYNIVPRLLGRSVSITQSIYFSSICKKTAHEKSCKFFFWFLFKKLGWKESWDDMSLHFYMDRRIIWL